MGNALGRSDDEWSVIVQISGLAIAFIVGFLGRPGRPLMPTALALGILVNIVAQMFLGGGGGSAFAGFIIYPLFYYLAAVVGRAVRWLGSFIRPAKTAAACNAPEDKPSHT